MKELQIYNPTINHNNHKNLKNIFQANEIISISMSIRFHINYYE